jgi:Protein of unknown function (DUF2950)
MNRVRVIGLAAAGILLMGGLAAVPGGKGFSSADAAAQALVKAALAHDVNGLIVILGPSSKDILSTSDPVADRKIRRQFVARAAQKMTVVPSHGRPGERTLLVGNDDWPLPIPIVERNGKWYFDMARGRQEILSRRIGSNELDAIEVSRGYVEAQNEYAEKNRTAQGVPYYAQKIVSSPGRRDGLYWEGGPGADQSPIGAIIARAFAEGYQRGQPFHGYYFKVLTGQGPHAPGGEKSYLDNGAMTRGYALIAWPANYGTTGIMTFFVNNTGIVYQKDLGHDTQSTAVRYSAYDPDSTWTPVREPSQP